MELKLVNVQGQDAGSLNVSEAVFGREYNEALVHQVVTAFLANARSGNSKQKTRSDEVRTGKHNRMKKFQAGTSRCTQAVAYCVNSDAPLRLSFRLICSR